jgi:hypothetical protein
LAVEKYADGVGLFLRAAREQFHRALNADAQLIFVSGRFDERGEFRWLSQTQAHTHDNGRHRLFPDSSVQHIPNRGESPTI